MLTTTFDSLGYAKKLEAAGFTREQAEVQANAFREFTSIQEENTRKELATKGDLQDVRNELKVEIAETKHEILKWMMGMLVAQTALIVAVIAFIK